MKLGEAFQTPPPWKLEIRFDKRGWATEIFINGESLEDVAAIELTCSPDRQPEICFKILALDEDDGIVTYYQLPAYVFLKASFSGSLKAEIEELCQWPIVTGC